MPQSPARARTTLWMLTALAALSFMDRQIVAVLLPQVKTEFALSDLQAGLVTGLGFALGFALMAVPLGRLADASDRIGVVAWCRGLGGLMAALGGMAWGAGSLALARVGCAVSDAGGGPASMSAIADLYPASERSRAMGTYAMGNSAGSLLALLGGAWLVQHVGWRLTLMLVGLTAMLAALALRLLVPRASASPTANAAPLGTGLASRGQVRAILAQPLARWLLLAASFALLCGYSFGTWNFTYLMRHFGLSTMQAGSIAALSALGAMLGAPLAGGLSDHLTRRDPRWQIGVPIIGLGMTLPLGLIYLSLPPTQVALAVAMVSGFAFCISFWVGPVYAALSMVVRPDQRGVANGLMLLVGAVGGGGFGPVLTGALSDAFMAQGLDNPLRAALVCVVLLLLGAIAALALVAGAYGRHIRTSRIPL